MGHERRDWVNPTVQRGLDEVFIKIEKDRNPLTEPIRNAIQTTTIAFMREGPKFLRTVGGLLTDMVASSIFRIGLTGGGLGLVTIWYLSNRPILPDFLGGFGLGAMVGGFLGATYPKLWRSRS